MTLIDRDVLNKEFRDFVRASNNSDFEPTPNWNDAVSLVGSAPTVDAVQVVRCRDCKHFERAYYKKDGTENFKYKRGVCCRKKRGMWVTKDWFCADGERR